MSKDYRACSDTRSDGTVTVREVLDTMPFGLFHVIHLSWAIVATAILAIQYEMTPYMFLGLQFHFGHLALLGLFMIFQKGTHHAYLVILDCGF